jgi:predicted TIM-barrel fold metal-dependent hydrolase
MVAGDGLFPSLVRSILRAAGASAPAGRSKDARAILREFADFPDLKIILAPLLPGEEALSVATHKPNVYIDLSGWSPKYFPPILVRYINSILQDKMLFGSDWPDRWLSDFAKLEIRKEIRPKVLKANARRLLGI